MALNQRNVKCYSESAKSAGISFFSKQTQTKHIRIHVGQGRLAFSSSVFVASFRASRVGQGYAGNIDRHFRGRLCRSTSPSSISHRPLYISFSSSPRTFHALRVISSDRAFEILRMVHLFVSISGLHESAVSPYVTITIRLLLLTVR